MTMIKKVQYPLLHEFLVAVSGGPGPYAEGSFNMDGVSGEDAAASEALLARLSEDERQKFATGSEQEQVDLAAARDRNGVNLLPVNTVRSRLPAKSDPLPSKKDAKEPSVAEKAESLEEDRKLNQRGLAPTENRDQQKGAQEDPADKPKPSDEKPEPSHRGPTRSGQRNNMEGKSTGTSAVRTPTGIGKPS
jgi:hypothetical protein